jgi:hypothetical protein
MVHEEDNIEKAEEPELGWCTGTVHDGVPERFCITNFLFSKALMFLIGLALEVFNCVEAKNVQHTLEL